MSILLESLQCNIDYRAIANRKIRTEKQQITPTTFVINTQNNTHGLNNSFLKIMEYMISSKIFWLGFIQHFIVDVCGICTIINYYFINIMSNTLHDKISYNIYIGAISTIITYAICVIRYYIKNKRTQLM